MNISSSVQISYFSRFMSLFDTVRFQIDKITKTEVTAFVSWADDVIDYQKVKWTYKNSNYINDALCLGEFLRTHNKIQNDKITIIENEIRAFLKWDDKKIRNAIKELLSIKVSMIDDEIIGDYFSFHL